MEAAKVKIIYSLLSQLGMQSVKEKLVSDCTDGRTTHVSEMQNHEANLLIRHLQQVREDRVVQMRKKIIHNLCLYGMTDQAGKPDYNRIDLYIQNIGSRNSGKKRLLYLSPKEMLDVLNQVTAMVKKTLSKPSKIS